MDEIRNKIKELDLNIKKQDLFDYLIQITDIQFTNGDFQSIDFLFEKDFVDNVSDSAITGLLRSTFVARKELPKRKEFLERKDVFDRITKYRKDGKEFIVNMI